MKRNVTVAVAILSCSVMLLATADGSWLKKVPETDRVRVNPYRGQSDAVEAGKHLYANECSKCHGSDATGRGSRPPLVSPRIAGATDGELAWMLRNGNPFKGMPSWSGLPEQQRWQIVTYLRSLQAAQAPGGTEQTGHVQTSSRAARP